MPRPGLPPTPGSSTDIKGQDGTQKLASLHMAFELPPPALHDAARVSPTDSHKPSPASPPSGAAPSAGYPMQAAETVKARRRSSAAQQQQQAHQQQGGKDSSFALPPPPTRSRKIIQMKPPQDDAMDTSPTTTATGSASKGKDTSRSGKGAGAKAAAAANNTGANAAKDQQQSGGKKKQPSATSAAGRKIARKTAHSLIERRRRSKMNEEFALLKSMIPACTGEMHKLAILQASIEYVRYLEDCVSKLKAQHEDDQTRAQLPSIREFHPTFRDPGAEDIDMEDSEAAVSPTFNPQPDHAPPHHPGYTHQPSVSPALHAQDARGRQHSYSSVSTADHRHYSYSVSGATSPAFGPQAGYAPSSAGGSTLTSPALNPQSDLDQEATAALLMLNNDRRGFNAVNGRRAVSVRDLLTS